MKLIILALLLLLVPCASADNITIEIFQNSNDEYFIQYNGELHACVGDECTFNITHNVTQPDDISLSTKDIQKIAQYVALEINIPTQTGGVNKTYFDVATVDTREDITNLRSWISGTLVKDIDKFDIEKSAKMAAEAEVEALNNKIIGHDAVVKSYEETLVIYKGYVTILIGLLGIFFFGFVGLLVTNSQSFKKWSQVRWGKR